jgi:DUF4097 and DUF4098 domain-containing protein YvlB
VAQLAAQQRELRAPAAADAVVSIWSENADVRVTGYEGDEVVVRVRTGSIRNVELTGDRARLRIRNEDDEDLDVRVPRRARVDLRSQNGDLSVSDVTGSIYFESLSGDARVSGDARLVEVSLVSGDIDVLGRVASIKVNTVSGDINLPHAIGVVDASTTSGDIQVSAEGLGRGNFSSTSGTVIFQGEPARDAALYFDSASGTIQLRLRRDFAGDFDISTVSGDIENTMGPRPTRLRYGAGMYLRFNTGAGARVRASSVSGTVRLLNQ